MFVLSITGHQDFQHGNILRALHEVKGDCTDKRRRLEVHHPSDGILSGTYQQICVLCTAEQQTFMHIHQK